MDYKKITDEQVQTLRNIKALEDKESMRFRELRELLDSITCFEEDGWDFTDDDYNSYDDDGELESVCDVIFSNDNIENRDPYVGPDGQRHYFEGQPVYEIDFCHDGDPESHPDDNDTISSISVEIWVPDELWMESK